jgi:hypothetical protein
MRIEQTHQIDSSPESVFDSMTEPANLTEWQTSKTRIETLTEGQPRTGFRVREWTKVPGRKEFEQVVEFTQFDRPTSFRTHIVQGPQPIDGTWVLSPAGAGTHVTFVAEGRLQGPLRIATPIIKRIIDRQFRTYHENLRRNVESRS